MNVTTVINTQQFAAFYDQSYKKTWCHVWYVEEEVLCHQVIGAFQREIYYMGPQ